MCDVDLGSYPRFTVFAPHRPQDSAKRARAAHSRSGLLLLGRREEDIVEDETVARRILVQAQVDLGVTVSGRTMSVF